MIMSTKEICKRGLSMTISLTLGNSGLPLGHRGLGHPQPGRQGVLGDSPLPPVGQQNLADGQFLHVGFPPSLLG